MQDKRWDKRLKELALLEDGWHDGNDGVKIKEEILDLVRRFLEDLDAQGLPIPAIFPMMDEAGMSMVWHQNGRSITLRVYEVTELEISRIVDKPAPATGRGHESFTFQLVEDVIEVLSCWCA